MFLRTHALLFFRPTFSSGCENQKMSCAEHHCNSARQCLRHILHHPKALARVLQFHWWRQKHQRGRKNAYGRIVNLMDHSISHSDYDPNLYYALSFHFDGGARPNSGTGGYGFVVRRRVVGYVKKVEEGLPRQAFQWLGGL